MKPRAVLIAGVAAVVLGLAGQAAADSRTPMPHIVPAKGEQCVEPTDVMRKNHMMFLKHHRDDTVHEGIRTTRHSLKGCIDCHAARDDQGRPVPVTSPGQFCQSCHSYAAVKMDCFSCHATTPEK